MQLSGNTILITGGSSGIGLEFAKFLSKNNTVIITGRNAERLDQVKKTLPGLHTIVSDVAHPKAIQELLQLSTKEFPKLNILINNAGVMQEINFHDKNLSDRTLTEEIEINLMGPIRMVHAFLPHLKRQPRAAIVNVTSGLAFVPLPISPVYCSTKAALHSFSQSLRVQLEKSSVKVFEVAPPATLTPMIEKSNKDDMKGITIMPVEDMVRASVAGIEKDQYEICPGQSSQLRFMSRIAPGFILKQLSKSAARMQST